MSNQRPAAMPQPDWTKAPTWASYAAMDATGAWYWYESEPVLAQHLGIFTSGGFRVEAVLLDTDWKESAHVRPLTEAQRRGKTVAPRIGELVLTIAAANAYPEGRLKDWLDAGWTADQMVAKGYAVEVGRV